MRQILKVGLLAVSLFALGCVSVSDRLARKAMAAGNSSSRMELSGRVHDLDECVKRIIKGRSDCRLVDVVYPVVENCPFVYVCTSSGNMVVDCAFETGDNAFAVIELSSDTQGILRACKLQEGVREAYKQKVELLKGREGVGCW